MSSYITRRAELEPVAEVGRRRFRRSNRSNRFRLAVIGLLVAGGSLLAACGSDATAVADDVEQAADQAGVDTATLSDADAEALQQQADALAETLRANGMETLASAIEQVDLAELIGDKPFTLFGPNDEAFLALTADDTADLLADPAQLTDVLRNHVVQERVASSDLAGMASVSTAGGQSLPVVADGEMVTVGGANVVTADIEVGGGVVHVIDQVLLP